MDRQRLHDHPSHGGAGHVRGRDAVRVEHAHGVRGHVVQGVGRRADFETGRLARVAVVVADHVPPAVDDRLDEVLLPVDALRARAHDEEQRRVRRVAEVLGPDVDAVRTHDLLSHVARPSVPKFGVYTTGTAPCHGRACRDELGGVMPAAQRSPVSETAARFPGPDGLTAASPVWS